MSLESRIKRLEQRQERVDYNDVVPFELEEFYPDFGYLTHEVTGQPVTELAEYQYRTTRIYHQFRRILEVKSNKIGETTKWSLIDFQQTVLPSSHPFSTRGFDSLLIAQTKEIAIEHLRWLRKGIADSPKYNKYLINKPDEIALDDKTKILRDEQSKTAAIFIQNPENPHHPSRIIAVGMDNPGSLLSRKRIKHLHFSDPTAAKGDFTQAMDNAISRLANSNGTCIIETIPGPPKGAVYNLWQKYRAVEWKPGYFKIVEVTVDEAVKAGVITPEFVESERERLGDRFPGKYMASFLSGSGNVFKTEDIERAIQLGKEMAEKYGLNPRSSSYKSQGFDPAYGSSNFGVCVVQRIDNQFQIIQADEYERPDIDEQIHSAAGRINTWPIQTTQVDASQPSFIAGLKRKIGEDPHYEGIDKERHKFMRVKPVPFSTRHKDMLTNMVRLMEKGWVGIHPKFEKLILSLRTAVAEDYSLDKEKTAHNDVFDACRLALEAFEVGSKRYAG